MRTVSKFLYLGLPLDEAMAKVTAAPARAMGMLPEIGTLAPSSWADIVIFRLQSGGFVFTDAVDDERIGEQKLAPIATVRAGKVYAAEGAMQFHTRPAH